MNINDVMKLVEDGSIYQLDMKTSKKALSTLANANNKALKRLLDIKDYSVSQALIGRQMTVNNKRGKQANLDYKELRFSSSAENLNDIRSLIHENILFRNSSTSTVKKTKERYRQYKTKYFNNKDLTSDQQSKLWRTVNRLKQEGLFIEGLDSDRIQYIASVVDEFDNLDFDELYEIARTKFEKSLDEKSFNDDYGEDIFFT